MKSGSICRPGKSSGEKDMPAIIRPIGPLKAYIGDKSEVEVNSGTTVREAIARIGIPPEIVALVLVNESAQNKDYLVQDGDLVRLLAVIGGG
jgi:sulfur carrier protein ThiS